MLTNKSIIQTICNFTDEPFSLSELKELDEHIEDKYESKEFYIELPNNGYEYRIISEYWIDDILEDSLEDLITDCYQLGEGSEWLMRYIDWKQMAKDTDYGEHFSSYDGSEESDNYYYYFRTN